ncbi:MAG: hypothetical protein ACF788_07895, partial [Novipirellula sp. JB048]
LLKHWLWVNAKCVALLIAFIAVLRYAPSAAEPAIEPGSATTARAHASERAQPEQWIHAAALGEDAGGGVRAAARSEEASEHRRPNPIPPTGWRRTNRGWEHTSSWAASSLENHSSSISELIAIQESREPMWLRSLMGRVSGIPPLMIAMLQLTLIALILTIPARTSP